MKAKPVRDELLHLRPDLVQDNGKSFYPLTLDSYGFTWGPVTVTRIDCNPKWGLLLCVSTKHECLKIRVSPKGRIIETVEVIP